MTLETLTKSATETQTEADSGDDAVEVTPADDAEPEPEPLSKDVVFEILKNQRRRDALAYLKDNGGVATLSDMAEFIAAKENDITIEQLSSSQRKRVYIGLYQCHLPKMASSGVIEFDKNRGDIELNGAAEQLDPYLTDDDDATASTSGGTANHVLLASGLGLAVVAGLAGVPVFDLVPDAGWAIISTGALMTLTVVESVRGRRD